MMTDLGERIDFTPQVVDILETTLAVDIESPDTDLLETGLLDSLGLIELIDELESAFGVEIPIDALELDDLRTPSNLAKLVAADSGALGDAAVETRTSVSPLPGGGEIRPMERGQLREVAALLLKKSGATSEELDRMTALLSEYLLDHPQADEEIPSLVAVDADDKVIGFIGSNVRRFDFNGTTVRMGCSGPLIIDPDAPTLGLGVFLMERYLAGPQDFTITDGATDTVIEIWSKLGGRRADEVRDRWTAVLRPFTFGTDHFLGAGGKTVKKLAAAADRLAGLANRWLLPKRPAIESEALSPSALVEAIRSLPPSIALRPSYDPDFLDWQLEIMNTVGMGDVRGALFRDTTGSVSGWYVYLLERDGISHVLQLAGDPSTLPDVFAHLLHDAYDNGAAVVDGRVEHHLRGIVSRRSIKIRPSSSHPLRHTNRPDLEEVLYGSSSFISRFDGESWMGAFGQAARAGGGDPTTSGDPTTG